MKSLKTLLFLSLFTVLLSCSNNDDNDEAGASCDTICEYTIVSGETAAAVPSTLDGTYNLTYHSAQPGSPFTNGTTATFTLSNNELTVEIAGGECLTIKNPVLRGSNNYLFKDDCRDNITYNLSPNNDGSFNEINIEPLGTGWLGQFSE